MTKVTYPFYVTLNSVEERNDFIKEIGARSPKNDWRNNYPLVVNFRGTCDYGYCVISREQTRLLLLLR